MRDVRSMMQEETTDITLFVKTSGEEVTRWDRQRIVDALVRETDLDVETAHVISKEVEKQIFASGISVLTTRLIRELVDAKLIERGLENVRKMHALIGFPLYDVRELILHRNKENANVPHGPEGTNLVLAEGIKREYSLHEVFSQEVADAHIMGDIHLHGLGYIDRPYSAHLTLEYIKKYGLKLPHALTVAKPAKHAEVLLSHMVRFGASLQGHFAGVISWDAVNLAFAPYLRGMNDREVRQLAQMLIYEFSQLTAARGGQAMFTDIHLYWHVPPHLRHATVIGPGGEHRNETYQEYLHDARRFAWQLFEVFKKGDGRSMPFIFPRPLVHISHDFFQSQDSEHFLGHICEVAGSQGNTCFLFDRNPIPKVFRWCYATSRSEDFFHECIPPWSVRCFAVHNVTLNLPRIAYRAEGKDTALFQTLSEHMELMAQAHLQKKHFIEKLMSYGDEGPLAMLAMNLDGMPYFIMNNSCYLMGILGLNELVRIHRGKELHESQDALEFGLKVVSFMDHEARRLGEKYGVAFVLEQSHAETTAHRFARLDLKYFSPRSGYYVRGDIAKGGVYYTNSSHLVASAAVSPFDRVKMEGVFHPFIGGGAATHLWLGRNEPTAMDIAAFVTKVYRETESDQVIFSPEHTVCRACNGVLRGLVEQCEACGSREVEGIARITQYFSRVSSWNRGKLAELRERRRYDTIS